MYEQQRRQAKELIMEKAVALFRHSSYDAVTVEQITRAVGIAKGTFYHFFKSKRDILMEWSAQQFAQMDVMGAVNPGKGAEQNVQRLVDIVVAAICEEKALFASFLKELSQADRNEAPAAGFDFTQVLSQVLHNSSDFARIGEEGLNIKTRVLSSFLFYEMLDWFQSGRELEGLADHLKATLHICINGIFKR